MGEKCWRSVRRGGRQKKCVEEVATTVCLRRPMKQTLTDVAVVRKRAARERLFTLLGYDLPATRKRAENDTKLEEELRNQVDEARVKLWGIVGSVLCA